MASEKYPNCPFCLENERVTIIKKTRRGYLVAALDPEGSIMPGCYLIIPTLHVRSIFELNISWFATFMILLLAVPGIHDIAFNINLNSGKAAGQRCEHLHFWVILRDEPETSPTYSLGLANIIRLFTKPRKNP